jgi:hypothetical protein
MIITFPSLKMKKYGELKWMTCIKQVLRNALKKENVTEKLYKGLGVLSMIKHSEFN